MFDIKEFKHFKQPSYNDAVMEKLQLNEFLSIGPNHCYTFLLFILTLFNSLTEWDSAPGSKIKDNFYS